MKQQRRWLLLAALILTLAVTGLFAWRAIHRWRDRPTFEPVEAWMSIPYVAHAYGLPPPVLFEALGFPPDTHDRRPLTAIAREQGRAADELVAEVEKTLASLPRRQRPPPPGAPTEAAPQEATP